MDKETLTIIVTLVSTMLGTGGIGAILKNKQASNIKWNEMNFNQTKLTNEVNKEVIAMLKEELAARDDRLDRVEADLDSFRLENKKLRKENQELVDESSLLVADYNDIKYENFLLKGKIEELENRIRILEGS